MMFKVRIVTPDGLYLEDDVRILNVVTSGGQLGILANHIPVVASLVVSIMTTDNGHRKHYAIGEGTLQFKDNLALILVDFCEAEDEIDVQRALAAKKRAESLIDRQDSWIDLNRAQRALRRADTRLKLKGHL